MPKKGASEIIYTSTRGDIDGCSPQRARCPRCFLEIAYWHTHGAFIDNDNDGEEDRGYDTENFSGTPSAILLPGEQYGDLNYAIDHNIDGYVGTPLGKILMYDHNGNKIIRKKDWK